MKNKILICFALVFGGLCAVIAQLGGGATFDRSTAGFYYRENPGCVPRAAGDPLLVSNRGGGGIALFQIGEKYRAVAIPAGGSRFLLIW